MDFKKKLLEHKTKLLKPIGNKKYELTYPELKDMEIIGSKIKNHWIFAQKSAKGDVEEFQDEWENLLQHYQEKFENSISAKTEEAFSSWLEIQSKDLEKYVNGYLTDLEESFHHSSLKYWKKGTKYSYEVYIMKKALAALD